MLLLCFVERILALLVKRLLMLLDALQRWLAGLSGVLVACGGSELLRGGLHHRLDLEWIRNGFIRGRHLDETL